MNFTAYYAIAGQTVKKLDGFQNRTDGVLSVVGTYYSDSILL